MEDRPYLLVGLLILILMLGSAAAWFFGSNSADRSSSSLAKQTFRAKSGTQRAEARALVNENREYDRSRPGTTTSTPEVWGRFEEGGNGATQGNDVADAERFAEQVVADLSAEEGIAVLEAELLTSDAPAHVYAGLIAMYAALDPPDLQRAEGAFTLAMANAQQASERDAALYQLMKAYAVRDDWDRVLALAQEHAPPNPDSSKRAFEIGILQAEGLRQTNRLSESTAVLENILAAEDIPERLSDPAFEAVYRQAALRLSRLYREMGNEERADAITRETAVRLRR